MPKISYTTLGCKLNFSETASIVREFTEQGYKTVKFGEKADITIINSCTVTAQAERKSVNATKKAAKISPEGKIIIIGCAAQTNPERFLNTEQVELVLGTHDKFRAYELLNSNHDIIYSCDIQDVNNFDIAYSTTERTRSFLKIQDGCDYPCTYCTIPKARGKSRNSSIKSILTEAEKIASLGIKEIILTGVNIGDFGKSTNETFYDLIKELDKLDGINRYRISSIEPNLLTTNIIKFVAKSEKFMPHFHIPLQSGSDDVLKLMKRRYNTKIFADKIIETNKHIPNAFFGIDVIVGFPGETEEHFEQTFNLLSILPISYLHIFPYSDRKGTPATAIKNKVPSEWIKVREQKLAELSNKKHELFYKKFAGKLHKVLFESKDENNFFSGFTDNYLKVAVESNIDIKNQIINVQLTNFKNGIFEGIIL
ncbi:MAG: tRNA (N(6)-L-threonylcarbamoyladenosine(37)-C(2))-methylthiotransferase MtaB [Bacteroidales bacterium]|nr:tRNA (N(6)-L-threonylcarbamoyladenosine(37)-C(2))-methylthiotransferase MtaB [Bacteroidales bacterium]